MKAQPLAALILAGCATSSPASLPPAANPDAPPVQQPFVVRDFVDYPAAGVYTLILPFSERPQSKCYAMPLAPQTASASNGQMTEQRGFFDPPYCFPIDILAGTPSPDQQCSLWISWPIAYKVEQGSETACTFTPQSNGVDFHYAPSTQPTTGPLAFIDARQQPCEPNNPHKPLFSRHRQRTNEAGHSPLLLEDN